MAGIGQPKSGGRKKGSKNARTLTLEERLDELGFDPIEEAVNVFRTAFNAYERGEGSSSGDGPDMTFKYLEIAQKTVADLMQYKYPKRKAIDHTSGGEPLDFSTLIAAAAKSDGSDEH